MSNKKDKKDKSTSETTPPTEPPETPSVESQLAELRVGMKTMAEAIVKLNEKIEAGKTASGGTASGGDFISLLAKLAAGEGKKETDLETVAKSAKALAELGAALDHYRNPPRLTMSDAILMRLGMRAAMPRYMTKAELERAERILGVSEVFSEGTSEHVEE